MSISPAGTWCRFPPYSMNAIGTPRSWGASRGTSKPIRAGKGVQGRAKSRQGRELGPQLEMIKLLVQTGAGEQVAVRSALPEHAVMQHQNLVGMLHRREPVRDHDAGAPAHQLG